MLKLFKRHYKDPQSKTFPLTTKLMQFALILFLKTLMHKKENKGE